MSVCSRTARITVNTGEEGGREGEREGGRVGRREGEREGGREGGREEEGVRWEVLGNSYRMYVLLKRRVASNS